MSLNISDFSLFFHVKNATPLQSEIFCLAKEAKFNENVTVVPILPFHLGCTAMSSTVLACLEQANSFLCSIWTLTTNMYVIRCWQSIWRTYIYVLECCHWYMLLAHEIPKRCICTSLVAGMQIDWVQVGSHQGRMYVSLAVEKFRLAPKQLKGT